MSPPGALGRTRRQALRGLAQVALAVPALAPVARAQPRPRRVAMLTALPAGDPVSIRRLAALRDTLAAKGWAEGRNLEIDALFGAETDALAEPLARQAMARRPDVLVVQGPAVPAARRAAGTTPIVFVVVADPIGAGYAQSLARPGGTLTGFTSGDPSLGGKWLDLLHEIAPRVRHVDVLGGGDRGIYGASIDATAGRLGLSVRAVSVADTAGIDAALHDLAARPSPGLVLPTNALVAANRGLIIARTLAARIPLVTGNPPLVRDGGLLYYGAEVLEQFRQAGDYVDRILRGTRPADLPVQMPTRFELLVNLRTAEALGLEVPASILAAADGLID